jgi:hypothetical protein
MATVANWLLLAVFLNWVVALSLTDYLAWRAVAEAKKVGKADGAPSGLFAYSARVKWLSKAEATLPSALQRRVHQIRILRRAIFVLAVLTALFWLIALLGSK